jgi:hypothetical protein
MDFQPVNLNLRLDDKWQIGFKLYWKPWVNCRVRVRNGPWTWLSVGRTATTGIGRATCFSCSAACNPWHTTTIECHIVVKYRKNFKERTPWGLTPILELTELRIFFLIMVKKQNLSVLALALLLVPSLSLFRWSCTCGAIELATAVRSVVAATNTVHKNTDFWIPQCLFSVKL